jgi:molecular chaperone GrpE (heat shock protein)
MISGRSYRISLKTNNREKEDILVSEELETERWLKAFALNDAVYEQHQEMRRTLLAFLEVLASFDRCFAAIDPADEVSPVANSWLRSFDGVRSQLLIALEQAEVSFMNCIGQVFDPTRHEAVAMRVASDVENNTILEEIMRGCEWRGEVLCYARVVVASSTPGDTSGSSNDNQKEI